MPVTRGHDAKGPFYRWGHQKRYYYVSGNAASRKKALMKAEKQGRAITLATLRHQGRL